MKIKSPTLALALISVVVCINTAGCIGPPFGTPLSCDGGCEYAGMQAQMDEGATYTVETDDRDELENLTKEEFLITLTFKGRKTVTWRLEYEYYDDGLGKISYNPHFEDSNNARHAMFEVPPDTWIEFAMTMTPVLDSGMLSDVVFFGVNNTIEGKIRGGENSEIQLNMAYPGVSSINEESEDAIKVNHGGWSFSITFHDIMMCVEC
jgi:hypothetical protein